MELRFAISGSVVFSTEFEHVPPVGSSVTITMESYKKGLHPGTIISFTVSGEFPPVYDYSEGGLIVYIDVNGYEVLKEGPSPD